MLAAGTASGLCRVDVLWRRWFKDMEVLIVTILIAREANTLSCGYKFYKTESWLRCYFGVLKHILIFHISNRYSSLLNYFAKGIKIKNCFYRNGDR